MSAKEDNIPTVSEGDSSSMQHHYHQKAGAFGTSNSHPLTRPPSQISRHSSHSDQKGPASTHNNVPIDPQIQQQGRFPSQDWNDDNRNGALHGTNQDQQQDNHANNSLLQSSAHAAMLKLGPTYFNEILAAQYRQRPSPRPQPQQPSTWSPVGQQNADLHSNPNGSATDLPTAPYPEPQSGIDELNRYPWTQPSGQFGQFRPFHNNTFSGLQFDILDPQQAVGDDPTSSLPLAPHNDSARSSERPQLSSSLSQAGIGPLASSGQSQQTQEGDDSFSGEPGFSKLGDEATSRGPRQASGRSLPCKENACKRKYREGSTLWDASTQSHIPFCKRHQDKWKRNNAPPPVFTYLPGIHSYEIARNVVYPEFQPLNLNGDDVHNEDFYRDDWVRRFIDAANQPYMQNFGNDYHDFLLRQQKVFNGKGFNNETVNVRMRFLYQAAYVLHAGGQQVYPDGGDNGGYGRTDKSQRFSDRLIRLIDILSRDKRVCMDVIEGRGVTAFVCNPEKYEKRKTQNKDSNERKQKKQMLGDRVQEKRAAKGKDRDRDEVDTDDYSGEESDIDGDEGARTAPEIYGTPMSMGMSSEAMAGTGGGLSMPPPPKLKTKRETKSTTPGPAKSTRSKKAKRAADAAQQHDVSMGTGMNSAQPFTTNVNGGGFASNSNNAEDELSHGNPLHEFDADAAHHHVMPIGAMMNPDQPSTADDGVNNFAAGPNGHDERLHDASEFQELDTNAEDEAAALRPPYFNMGDWVNDH